MHVAYQPDAGEVKEDKMVSEAKRRANAKWDKDHLVKVTIRLNREKDADILAWLDRQQSKQGAIKDAVRAWMEE